jgi:hypothetical protein
VQPADLENPVMKRWTYRSVVVLGCLVASTILVLATATRLDGVFALQGKMAQTSASLATSPVGNDPLARKMDIVLTENGSHVPIRAYDLDMTKLMHVIIVSDDFILFLHVHPVLQNNGHFVLEQRFPFPGLYHIYADAQPHGIGQQVFRFDVPIGSFQPAERRGMGEMNTTARVGGYTVTLSTNTLYTNTETMISVQISKHGKPATDLHSYLGAPAHAVFLNAEDLSYVHVHPMPDPMGTPGSMMLHVTLNEPGPYKLWLQFRGGTQLIVAPFVIVTR